MKHGCLAALHHPVSTGSADAQKFFEQGLTYVYAFNHPEAVRSFERAAQLDPRMAMGYWGIALTPQNRAYDAALVRREFESAWRHADTQLRLEDL